MGGVPRMERAGALAPWVGLLVAFSPALVDLLGHWQAHPWSRVSLVFVGLAISAIRRAPRRDVVASRRILWLGLGSALLLELLAMGGDVPRLARLAFVGGVISLAVGLGRAGPVPAAVVLWVVPLPSTLLAAASPGLESLWGRLAAALVPGVGCVVEGGRAVLVGPAGRLPLGAAEGGLALGFALAGLGWFRAARDGAGAGMACVAGLRAALLFAPLQILILALVALLLGLRSEPASVGANALLAHGGWLVGLALGLAALLEGSRSRAGVVQAGPAAIGGRTS